MTIELSAEKPRKHEFYRATLDLPATELQIEDALSKARFQNESSKKYIDIEEAILFDPSHLSVTADDIHMLNYLAKRASSVTISSNPVRAAKGANCAARSYKDICGRF